ncbi:MAG: sigma-70 family RNA polymerase sigma factor [Candidatus Obscuribacterales bacterium]|nr:sigma-70 family RNA polymerase sigma factor [Steroidobacteraceae bacterium]
MSELRTPYGKPDAGVTRLLSAWRAGDVHALERLTPLVYDELRELARRYMRRERPNHTLQATAVVHEAFVRLVGMDVPWQDRGHFYAVAARLMRRILVDHAKARHRVKRGGPVTVISVDVYKEDTDHVPATQGEIDVLEIDEALERLAIQDERLANAVELHYFGGLTYQETAKAMGISEATVHRDLRLAKAWILNQIRAPTQRSATGKAAFTSAKKGDGSSDTSS